MSQPATRQREITTIAWLFLGFPLMLITIFVFLPIAYSFFISFFDWNLVTNQRDFIGLGNYTKLFSDSLFWKSARNTIFYTIGVVPIQTFLALFLAFVMNQKIKGRTFFRVAFYVPAITSSVVTSTLFIALFSKQGLVNQLSGFDNDWLTNPRTAMLTIMANNIWTTSGYFMVSFLAGLQSIPDSLYEAARIDGASTWQQFWKITVPMVRPVTYFVLVLGLIGCFQVFDQIFIMSAGGPVNSTTTMSYYVYVNGFKYFKLGYAAAAAIVLAVLIFSANQIQNRYFKPEVD
ncbi:carbohydrate ABC transporter permease [Spirosoma areae]